MIHFSVSIPLLAALRYLCVFLSIIFTLSLSGCAGEKQTLIWDTFKLGVQGNDGLIDKAELNPNFRYMRVEVNGRPALMVLGYENTLVGNQHQTWYSSAKEMLQLENGRLVGTGGLDVNWTDVFLMDAPAINSPALFPNDGKENVKIGRNPKVFFFRTRSLMPQYVVNIREAVVMQGLNSAPDDVPKLLRDPAIDDNLKWVQETIVLQPNNPSVPTLRAIYAYEKDTRNIIYGQQCLSEKECLSWLAWPYPNERVTR